MGKFKVIRVKAPIMVVDMDLGGLMEREKLERKLASQRNSFFSAGK